MTEYNDDWAIAQTEESEENEADVIPYEISYYPADITLKGYLDKHHAGQLRIPDFQRDFVWDQVRASKLIESFLLGLPVPGVFLYKERKSNRLLVVDGQQRIMSAVSFFRGRFQDRIFKLRNVREPWNGKTFDELDESQQFQLHDSVLRATIVQQLDPKDDSSIYHIFERLNTGGVNLNPMEIRKCVYHGRFYSLIEELNKSPEWQAILGRKTPDKRLKDVELVLRVLAMADAWQSYTKPMKQFLNDHMIKYISMDGDEQEHKLAQIREDFNETLSHIHSALGERPFHLRGRLNYAVLDSVFATLMAGASIPEDELGNRYEKLSKDDSYVEACTQDTSDEKVVKRRFTAAQSYLLDYEQ